MTTLVNYLVICSITFQLFNPGFVTADDDEKFPVRWKSPECLTKHQYSTASDVWAFGVLMYEVLTRGCVPYSHLLDDKEVSFQVSIKILYQSNWKESVSQS